jgi:hypothetical protein
MDPYPPHSSQTDLLTSNTIFYIPSYILSYQPFSSHTCPQLKSLHKVKQQEVLWAVKEAQRGIQQH